MTQTQVTVSASGPPIHYRHWLRRMTTRELLLDDLRALVADADRLGLTDDHLVVASFPRQGRKNLVVYSIGTKSAPPTIAAADTPSDDRAM